VGALQSAPGVGGSGRVRSRSICLGLKLIAFRQGRQPRDAAAAGEEQLGKFSAWRLYLSRRYTFGDFESLAYSFAAGAPSPTHVWIVATMPAPAAQKLGVEQLFRPCTATSAKSVTSRAAKNSALACGGTAGGRREEACLVQWCALSLHGTQRHQTASDHIYIYILRVIDFF
jgi:hypothetical protein